MEEKHVSIYKELYPEKYRNYLLLSVICLGIAGFIEGPMHFLNFNKNDHIEEWLPQEVNDIFAYYVVVYYAMKFAGPVFLCIATGVGSHMWFQAVRHNYSVRWVRWIVAFFSFFGFLSTLPVSTLSFEITTLIGSILTLHASKFIPTVEEAKAAIAAATGTPAAHPQPAMTQHAGPALAYSDPRAKAAVGAAEHGAAQPPGPGESYKKLDAF